MSVRSSLQRFHIPAYSKNAVVQLIVFSGVGFVAVRLVWVTLIVYAVPESRAFDLTFRYVGLGNQEQAYQRWWTLFTYAWCHRGFWEWLSNMLWLYCFGNVVQNLVGYKQIIPLFMYSILTGALVFTGIQYLPSAGLPSTSLMMGAQGGILALMSAGLTLSPKYRLYLSDYFSVPLWLLAGIFTILIFINSGFHAAYIAFILGSVLTGVVYMKLLQNGYQPGAWIYRWFHKMDRKFQPRDDAPVRSYTKTGREELIDRLLDKINEQGYHSLTQAEKDQLREHSR